MNIRYPIYEGVYRILTKHQCRHPDPFVCSQPRDKLSCFHDRTVLIGETCHFLFRGRKADCLHRQGFRGKYRSPARMIFPETCKARPCRWKPAVRYLCPGNGMTGSVPFSTFGLWKNKFQVKALVKGDHGIE